MSLQHHRMPIGPAYLSGTWAGQGAAAKEGLSTVLAIGLGLLNLLQGLQGLGLLNLLQRGRRKGVVCVDSYVS